MPVSMLLYGSGKYEVKDAFESDDTESRVWVIKLQVRVARSAPMEATVRAEVEVHQNLPGSPGYQLPVPNSNQTAVANEIILRILLMQGIEPRLTCGHLLMCHTVGRSQALPML